jgi:biofilm protein TabA
MKRFNYSGKIGFIILIISVCWTWSGCKNNPKGSGMEKDSMATNDTWFSDKAWLQGLNLIPSESINQEEFSRQYHLKNTWWDEAFNYLKTQDLGSLKPGTYDIDSGNVYAMVWEGLPMVKDSVLWEAHHNFNDLQYIIHGKTEMGIASIEKSEKMITVPYAEQGDIEHFTVSAGDHYFPADSTTFFIFTPKDMHRPAIRVDGINPIKKIVIKVRVPD